MFRIILAAAALVAAPAFAQTTDHSGDQLGHSMGRDAQAAPHSAAGDRASGAAHTPTHKAMHRAKAMHRKPDTGAMSGRGDRAPSNTTTPR